MKKLLLIISSCMFIADSYGQSVTQKLQKAFQQFESDSQLKHAISSLYVIDAKTGQVVFDKKSMVGLAPASTQKIITSVTAFELLGKDYRYKTQIGYNGEIVDEVLKGNLFIHAKGDPTFGSWRFSDTKDSIILYKWANAVKKLGVKNITGQTKYNFNDFEIQSIPDGWIWQDIGNYYGASAEIINWKENQYDIILRSDIEVGSEVEIVEPSGFLNDLKAAPIGTGDNAYAYFPRGGYMLMPLLKGTIPINEQAFKISASDPATPASFFLDFGDFLNLHGVKGGDLRWSNPYYWDIHSIKKNYKPIHTHYSPSLDSIIYWFNKKSINLYGEALIKTFAYEKQGFGSTDSGVSIVKKFWKDKGLDEDELNIYDGSGLSPLNRVTTHAQVEILKYAKTKDWFPYFLKSLPDYNGMTMKSGTISDVKGFCGYHKAKDGKEYIFSFLVNNYNGKTSGVVGKMYKVLDELK